MSKVIAITCFAFLTMIGCVATDPTDNVATDSIKNRSETQEYTIARVREAVSTQMDKNVNNGGILPKDEVITCIQNGTCGACCGSVVCCSSCGNGPILCTAQE